MQWLRFSVVVDARRTLLLVAFALALLNLSASDLVGGATGGDRGGCGRGLTGKPAAVERPPAVSGPIDASLTPIPSGSQSRFEVGSDGEGLRVWWSGDADAHRAEISFQGLLDSSGDARMGARKFPPRAFGSGGLLVRDVVQTPMESEAFAAAHLSVRMLIRMHPDEPFQEVGSLAIAPLQVVVFRGDTRGSWIHLLLMSNGQVVRRKKPEDPWRGIAGVRLETGARIGKAGHSGCGLLEGGREVLCWGGVPGRATWSIDHSTAANLEDAEVVELALERPAASLSVGYGCACAYNAREAECFGACETAQAWSALTGGELPEAATIRQLEVGADYACLIADTPEAAGRIYCRVLRGAASWHTPENMVGRRASSLSVVTKASGRDPRMCALWSDPADTADRDCVISELDAEGIRRIRAMARHDWYQATEIAGDTDLGCRLEEQEVSRLLCRFRPFGSGQEPHALTLGGVGHGLAAAGAHRGDDYMLGVCAILAGGLVQCTTFGHSRPDEGPRETWYSDPEVVQPY